MFDKSYPLRTRICGVLGIDPLTPNEELYNVIAAQAARIAELEAASTEAGSLAMYVVKYVENVRNGFTNPLSLDDFNKFMALAQKLNHQPAPAPQPETPRLSPYAEKMVSGQPERSQQQGLK